MYVSHKFKSTEFQVLGTETQVLLNFVMVSETCSNKFSSFMSTYLIEDRVKVVSYETFLYPVKGISTQEFTSQKPYT